MLLKLAGALVGMLPGSTSRRMLRFGWEAFPRGHNGHNLDRWQDVPTRHREHASDHS